jgi:hypothetical protein
LESPGSRFDPECSTAARWTLETLYGQSRLFDNDPPALARELSDAPVFALDLLWSPEDGDLVDVDRWQLELVRSPPHESETPVAILEMLDRVAGPPLEWPADVEEVDPRLFMHAQRAHHLGVIGETDVPIVPRTLFLPAGPDVALAALESAVEDAWRSFREWGSTVGLPLPPADASSPWAGASDLGLDVFVVQLVGALEDLSDESLPPFISSRYRLDFDPSSPPNEEWATRLNARIAPRAELRRLRSFAEKFPANEIASGLRLWVELIVWDLVAEAEAASAAMLMASCEELELHLKRPGSPIARLDLARRRWLRDPAAFKGSWLCAPEEREWQLGVLASAPRTPRTEAALRVCSRAVQPRMLLIDEPERHLGASVAKDAATWLRGRIRPGTQIVIATHSAAFLDCHGDDVLHVHVQRASNGLIYKSFTPADDAALLKVAKETGLDHGELFGLVKAIVWVEGPMDRAVLDELCGVEMRRRGIHIATYGGLGNARSILESPLARLPDLRFLVLVDDLDSTQIDEVTKSPDLVGKDASHEMREMAAIVLRAQSSSRQLAIASHGAPDVFLALSDAALAEIARRPWPGKEKVLRDARREKIPKAKLKGFVADRYGLKVDEANCGCAAKLMSADETPAWTRSLLVMAEGE